MDRGCRHLLLVVLQLIATASLHAQQADSLLNGLSLDSVPIAKASSIGYILRVNMLRR
jgi:hypothetical protein